jgi:predicted 3-demethylubiquinone-9 3-methyltransferase (glyoxalase superfamily)
MQKISPFIWLDNQAGEAMDFYTSTFPNSKITNHDKMPDGKTVMGTFEIMGYEIMVLNGGPQFKPNASISLFAELPSSEEVERIWNILSEGGEILMPLDKYDFSEKYGWLNDKYGVSWQLFYEEGKQSIFPSLMFVGDVVGKAEEAMNLYTSIFPESKLGEIARYPAGGTDKEGTIMFGEFFLHNQRFTAMDSALDHKFAFSEGVSLFVRCSDQEEVDKYWNALTANGGEESMCGWLKDKFGVSWQIIPEALGRCLSNPDPEKAKKAMDAMLQMKKIVVADLEKAVE